MRRPLPPELIALGDQLEAAASLALVRRRTRRQLFLNGTASLLVAVPLAAALISPPVSAPPAPAPVETAAGAARVATPILEDVLPRDLSRLRHSPQSELLLLPSSYRRALR